MFRKIALSIHGEIECDFLEVSFGCAIVESCPTHGRTAHLRTAECKTKTRAPCLLEFRVYSQGMRQIIERKPSNSPLATDYQRAILLVEVEFS